MAAETAAKRICQRLTGRRGSQLPYSALNLDQKNSPEHTKGHAAVVLWSQDLEQVPMISPVGPVFGVLASRVLAGASRTESYHLLGHRNRSTNQSSVVQSGIQRGSVRSSGVDPLSSLGQRLKNGGPIPALGSICQSMPHLSLVSD